MKVTKQREHAEVVGVGGRVDAGWGDRAMLRRPWSLMGLAPLRPQAETSQVELYSNFNFPS